MRRNLSSDCPSHRCLGVGRSWVDGFGCLRTETSSCMRKGLVWLGQKNGLRCLLFCVVRKSKAWLAAAVKRGLRLGLFLCKLYSEYKQMWMLNPVTQSLKLRPSFWNLVSQPVLQRLPWTIFLSLDWFSLQTLYSLVSVNKVSKPRSSS